MSSYTLQYDSELLQHFSPYVQHGKSRNLATVYDENYKPIVFTITDDERMTVAVTVADSTTKRNSTYDLLGALNIFGTAVHVAAFQDNAQRIHLAFVVNPRSKWFWELYICTTSTPDAWRHPEKIKSYLITPQSDSTFMDVRDLVFYPNVNPEGSGTSPFLAVEWVDPARPGERQFDWIAYDSRNWRIPKHPNGKWLPLPPANTQLIDKTVLTLVQNGLWFVTAAIYLDQGIPLIWMGFSQGGASPHTGVYSYMSTQGLNPRALGSCLSTDGLYQDVLLIAGSDGLWYMSPERVRLTWTYGPSRFEPQRLKIPGGGGDVFFRNVEDMVTAQSGSKVSVFARTQDFRIVHQMFEASTVPEIVEETVPILDEDVLDFSPLFSASSQGHRHDFMLLNRQGEHLVLQYKSTSGVWEEKPFLIESNGPTAEIPSVTSTVSYNSHVLIRGPDGQPSVNQDVTVEASDNVTVEINGTEVSIGPGISAVTLQTDFLGRLSIVVPVDSLGSAAVFRVFILTEEVKGSPIDPAIRIHERLGAIKNGDNLRRATLQTGGPLIQNQGDPNVDQVGNDISKLHAQYSSLKGASPFRTLASVSKGWRAFHFIQAAVKDVEKKVEHAFKTVEGKIISMVVTIEGNALELLIDTVERVAKAISLVLSKIEVELQKIVDWIGMIFSWKDIKRVKDDMRGVASALLGGVKVWVPELVPKLTQALDSAESTIETMLDRMTLKHMAINEVQGNFTDMVHSAALKQTSHASEVVPSAGIDPMNKHQTSPGTQWTSNQAVSGNLGLPSGGRRTAFANYSCDQGRMSVRTPGNGVLNVTHHSCLVQFTVRFPSSPRVQSKLGNTSPQSTDAMTKLAQDLERILGEIASDVERFGEGLLDTFKNGIDKIGVELVGMLVTFLKDVLRVLKAAVEAVLAVIEEFIGDLVDSILDATLDLPFITALWKLFNGGEELPKLLDIACVLMAIPTSAAAKLIAPEGTQPAWPDLQGWTDGTNFSQLHVDQVDLGNFFGDIKDWIENPSGARSSRPKPTPAGVREQTRPRVRQSNWLNLSKAEIVGHPVATGVESLFVLLKTLAAKKSKASGVDSAKPAGEPAALGLSGKTLELLTLICEVVALAFSFPNLEGFDAGAVEGGEHLSKALQIIAFVLRFFEVLIGGFALYKGFDAEETWLKALRSLMAVLQFIMNFVAAVVRYETTDDGTEQTFAAVAEINTFTSVGQKLCVALGPSEPPALAFATVFGALDTALDVGRGAAEWATSKSSRAAENVASGILSAGTHEFGFGGGAEGEVELLQDNYAGTHQIVNF